jgi:hypothetical protein
MTERPINISGNTGDVIGVGVSGTGNIIAKNLTVQGNLTVNTGQLSHLPSEYSRGLQEFTQAANDLLRKNNVPPEKVTEVNQQLQEFTKEVQNVKPDAKVGIVQQSSLKGRFSALADTVLRLLPKTAESAAAFTPLAPFSKLVGEGVQSLVNAIQKEA